MPYITFILLAIVFFLLLALNKRVKGHKNKHDADVSELQRTLFKIDQKIDKLNKNLTQEPKQVQAEEPEPAIALSTKTDEKIAAQSIPEVEEKEQITQKEPSPEIIESKVEEHAEPTATSKESEYSQAKDYSQKATASTSKSFFEKHPDLEKFIGENLINKIGIAILVLGLGFLVRYAIDKNWINEIARVAIGILSAGGLIGLAHKMRINYKSFSSVLIGGGLALLYYTITLAYHTEGYPLYQQQSTSFILLIFITVFAVVMSIAYDRVEIAILAIIGGFGSPLMLSIDSDKYIVLLSYLTLLNVGMLILAYFKKWRLVNIVSFAFTVLLFTTWLVAQLIDKDYKPFNVAIFFATGFYVIFFLMNIIYNLKHNISFKVADISLLLSNTFIYFTYMMIMLSHIENGAYKGLFSILLGSFNFGFAYFTNTRQKTDANLLYLLIGLVLTFITLAIPLQLKGNYITLFWSIESVLLLWLGQKSGFKILKLGSVIVSLLMLISLVMDWHNNYEITAYFSEDYVKQLGILLNKMFITTLFSGISLAIVFIRLKHEEAEDFAWVISTKAYRSIVLSAMCIVFYIGGLLEAIYQLYHFYEGNSTQSVAIFAYHSLILFVLLLFSFRLKEKKFSIVVSAISALFLLVFVSAISNVYANSIFTYISSSEANSITPLVFRWISILAVYGISILLFKLVNKLNKDLKNELFKLNISLLIFIIIYLLSADLDTIAALIVNSKNILVHTQKLGYAILWGISSFVLMIIGMRKKEQIIRILSLVLFAITIVKLFVYDISNIPEGGKIVAFILLGILLLIISFMYQKVKRLVIDDNVENLKKEPEISNK